MTSDLDVFEAERHGTLLEQDRDFLATLADRADALDLSNALAVNIERTVIIAVEGEGVLTVFGGLELGSPNHGKSVLQAGLGGADDTRVFVFNLRGLQLGKIRHLLPLALIHRADEVPQGGLGWRERVILQEFFRGPRGGPGRGRGAHGLDELRGDSTGITSEVLTDVGQGGGDLLVAQHGTLRRHDDVVGFTRDFHGASHPLEHNLDGALSWAFRPIAAD